MHKALDIVRVRQMRSGKNGSEKKTNTQKSHIKRIFRRYQQKTKNQCRSQINALQTFLPSNWIVGVSHAVACVHTVRTRFIHLKEQSKLFRKINHDVRRTVGVGVYMRTSRHNQYTPKISKLPRKLPCALHLSQNSNFFSFFFLLFFFFISAGGEVNWVRRRQCTQKSKHKWAKKVKLYFAMDFGML